MRVLLVDTDESLRVIEVPGSSDNPAKFIEQDGTTYRWIGGDDAGVVYVRHGTEDADIHRLVTIAFDWLGRNAL